MGGRCGQAHAGLLSRAPAERVSFQGPSMKRGLGEAKGKQGEARARVHTLSHAGSRAHSSAYTRGHTHTHTVSITHVYTSSHSHTLTHSHTASLSHMHTHTQTHMHTHSYLVFAPKIRRGSCPPPETRGSWGGGGTPRAWHLAGCVLQRPVPAESRPLVYLSMSRAWAPSSAFWGSRGGRRGGAGREQQGRSRPAVRERGGRGSSLETVLRVVDPPGVPADRETGHWCWGAPGPSRSGICLEGCLPPGQPATPRIGVTRAVRAGPRHVRTRCQAQGQQKAFTARSVRSHVACPSCFSKGLRPRSRALTLPFVNRRF